MTEFTGHYNQLDVVADHLRDRGWMRGGGFTSTNGACILNTMGGLGCVGEHSEGTLLLDAVRKEIASTCSKCSQYSDWVSITIHNDNCINDQAEAVELVRRAARRLDK